MNEDQLNVKSHRRGFIARVSTGIAAFSLAGLVSPFNAMSQPKPLAAKKPTAAMNPADEWFLKVKGRHKVVYDAPRPNEIMPFAWPKVFLLTNQATGSPESDCGVVVVLRHTAICYAFKDSMWAKYNFEEVFGAGNPGPTFQAADAAVATKTRNPFLSTNLGDFKIPGFGAVDIAIPQLQASGVMFCVCSAAMTVFSTIIAGKMNMKPEEVMNDWNQELIPGIQPVPSGVWALGRAQEHGCHYIFAG